MLISFQVKMKLQLACLLLLHLCYHGPNGPSYIILWPLKLCRNIFIYFSWLDPATFLLLNSGTEISLAEWGYDAFFTRYFIFNAVLKDVAAVGYNGICI